MFDLISRGSIQPVTPKNLTPISDIEIAFRQLQAGKHIGKVVLKADSLVEVKAYFPMKVENETNQKLT